MTSTEAAVFSPRNRVVIPVRNLRDLRSTLDVLASATERAAADIIATARHICMEASCASHSVRLGSTRA
jgi:hypothetical protein